MSRNSTPLYHKIAEDLIDKIESGSMKPHDPFPTQLELAKLYNTSEITTKRAYTELVKAGYVYRIKRKGTFVEDRRNGLRTASPEADEIWPKGGKKSSAGSMKKVCFAYTSIQTDRFNHRFFNDLFEGIAQICSENNIIFETHELLPGRNPPDLESTGIICINMELEELKRWKSAGGRIVTVHGFFPNSGIPYAISDNLTGGYIATEHLLALGHRRIGILLTGQSPLLLNQEFSLRFQGYRLAMSQHRIDTEPELTCVIEYNDFPEQMGKEGYDYFRSLSQPPSAVFCSSDAKAIGFIRSAQEDGVKVPDEISVVGYDDVFFSRWMTPSLTTINQNSRDIGQKAVTLLMEEWMDASVQGRVRDEIIVPVLVKRDSAIAIRV